MWEDNVYDVAVIDAFQGERTLRWLELFVQGGTQPLRTKGGQTMKRHNIPVIVCSNSDIAGAYARLDPYHWNILECRFAVVHIGDFINFYLPG